MDINDSKVIAGIFFVLIAFIMFFVAYTGRAVKGEGNTGIGAISSYILSAIFVLCGIAYMFS